jgi:hypothetical protein
LQAIGIAGVTFVSYNPHPLHMLELGGKSMGTFCRFRIVQTTLVARSGTSRAKIR